MFSKPVIQLITQRCSWRNYNGKAIEEDKKKQLIDFMSKVKDCPFGSIAAFELVHDSLDGKKTVPGTYGLIKRAESFIVGTVKKAEKDLEDFGFLFEKIILYATDIGLSTCWMGGTFSQTSFADKVALKQDETLPAISPVGYPAKKRAMMDTMIHLTVGSKRRKPWKDIFFNKNSDTALQEKDAGKYAIPLEMARLAPSSSNSQPWRIIKDKDRFHFLLKRSIKFDKFSMADLQRIDMGICMSHFELVAREAGLSGKWDTRDMGPLPKKTEYVATWVTQ